MTTPGHRFATCRCGHPKEEHDTPGFDGQCTARGGCSCQSYRPNLSQPVAKPVVAHTPPAAPVAAAPSVRTPADVVDITVRGERPPTLEQILAAGKRSEIKRTVALTEKVALQIHDLRSRLTDERRAAEDKLTKTREQEEARAEVARLTAQLEAAKAKLRGRTPPSPKAAKPPREPGDHPCPDCPDTFGSPQGIAMHRVRKHGYRKAG